jgi:hypothetical protein
MLRVAVDHLVYGVPDLSAGIDAMERLLGVRATPGGKHTGGGTHNALLSLGRTSYLEIIAPDPEQPEPAMPRPFGLDSLRQPGLVTWALRVQDLEARVKAAREAGYDPGPVLEMSRTRPDGTELRWRLAFSAHAPGDGVVPFLIEWAPGEHPAQTSPAGCTLVEGEAEHPHPEKVQPMLEALGVELAVNEGGRPALIATIDCPRGRVVLS